MANHDHESMSPVGADRDLLIELRVRTNQLEDRLERLEGNGGTPRFLTRVEFLAAFHPVRMIVYGLVGLVLSGVATAVLTLILRKGAP